MPKLNNASSILIYDDESVSNNPVKRFVDWRSTTLNVSVTNPSSKEISLPPSSSATVFSGTRVTSIDGTTEFDLTLNPVLSSVYRATHSAGTAPAFRTDRAIAGSGQTITVTTNNNATAVFAAGGAIFGAAQVGDVMFVPTALTGDGSLLNPLSVLNGGYWSVIAVSATALTVTRLAGESFSGANEVVVLTDNLDLQVFSSTGVQVGDSMEISNGFSVVTQKTFIVTAVTPSWVEFVSTDSLPLETGIIPTASGMVFYTDAKRFIRIESDQEIVVRYNGDTGNTNRISPREAGLKPGWDEKWGPVWQLVVVNRSATNTAFITFISAE